MKKFQFLLAMAILITSVVTAWAEEGGEICMRFIDMSLVLSKSGSNDDFIAKFSAETESVVESIKFCCSGHRSYNLRLIVIYSKDCREKDVDFLKKITTQLRDQALDLGLRTEKIEIFYKEVDGSGKLGIMLIAVEPSAPPKQAPPTGKGSPPEDIPNDPVPVQIPAKWDINLDLGYEYVFGSAMEGYNVGIRPVYHFSWASIGLKLSYESSSGENSDSFDQEVGFFFYGLAVDFKNFKINLGAASFSDEEIGKGLKKTNKGVAFAGNVDLTIGKWFTESEFLLLGSDQEKDTLNGKPLPVKDFRLSDSFELITGYEFGEKYSISPVVGYLYELETYHALIGARVSMKGFLGKISADVLIKGDSGCIVDVKYSIMF